MASKSKKSKGEKKPKQTPQPSIADASDNQAAPLNNVMPATDNAADESDNISVGACVTADQSHKSADRIPRLQMILYLLIGAGTIIRLLLPFLFNPMSFIYSDMLRHYEHALHPLLPDIMSLVDQPCYQIWLGTVLGITGDSKIAVALYSGLLSAVTPWFWYRWMRECLPSKSLALAGYATLALLPPWIRMYSYFMQETLLLPLLGLSLWLSWRAVRRKDTLSFLLAAVTSGCTTATKANAAPLELIVLIWMVKRSFGSGGIRMGLRVGAIALLVPLAIYLLGPVKFYNRANVWVLTPSTLLNQLYYESGQRVIKLDYKFADKATGAVHTGSWWFESPSMICPMLAPLSDWRSSRTGVYETRVDLTSTTGSYRPNPEVSLAQRLHFTMENVLFFFFGMTFPMDKMNNDSLDSLLVSIRWIWFPLALATAWLALKRRRADILTVLSLGSLAFYLLQQNIIFEGRYRMPWEGVAVASFLSLLPARSGEQLELSWERMRIPVISTFLIFYIYGITLWLLLPSPRRDAILKPVEPLITYTGLWQGWTMFSPDPRMVNLDLDAIITYSDGTTTVWQYPRVDKLAFFEKMLKERYRKFGYDHLNWAAEKILWPDFARWVARINNSGGPTPVKVQLERHWAHVPPPEKGIGNPLPPHANQYLFFTYEVKPEDLQ
jgi:hypothetical protein